MSIVFIVPDKEIAETARQVFSEFTEDIQIVQGFLSEVIPLAKQLEQQGAEVFVARGGTVSLLRERGIKCPIVEIHLTTKDIAEALTAACEKAGVEDPRIAAVAFPNMIQDIVDFLPFLKLDLRCYCLHSEDNASTLIDDAIAQGAQVLLGGAVTTMIAKARGIPSVLLGSGEPALRNAVAEAQRINQARRLESRRSTELKAIVEYAYEGIVAVNMEGTITVYNPVAQCLTGVRHEEALGHPAASVVPSINFKNVLESGSEDIGQLIDLGKSKAMLSRIPIRVHGMTVGVGDHLKT